MQAIAARMDFDQAVAIFNAAFNPNNRPDVDVVHMFRITQADIRLEQPILATSTQITFPVLSNIQNQAQQFNTEIRLPLQDSFVPTSIGMFLALPSSTADTTFQLYPYANPFIFPNAVNYRSIYNGTLKIMINNDQLLKNWMIQRHWKANQTQQTAAAGAGSPVDQIDGMEDGFVPMQPFVLLQGSQDLQITVNMPVAPAAVDANARMIMIFRGLQAQNSTVVN